MDLNLSNDALMWLFVVVWSVALLGFGYCWGHSTCWVKWEGWLKGERLSQSTRDKIAGIR